MKIIRDVKGMQAVAERLYREGKTVGFVPTMGYFHEGHLSLMRIARKQADVVVASIYVNPTQFGPNEDLDKYPRDFERDETLAEKEGVDILFYPDDSEMYPEGYLTYVKVHEITEILCGASRPTHFQGVTTICAKLFHIIKPHFAVFGQKDYQQAVVIRRMVRDLNFDLEIVLGPIVREKDGLAMSSRNTYLSAEGRKSALALCESLRMAEKMIQKGERSSKVLIESIRKHIQSKPFTKIDYVSIVHPETLQPLNRIEDCVVIVLAVFVGQTRLIDNAIIQNESK
jgi:pantoate--beta-alanine ligase